MKKLFEDLLYNQKEKNTLIKGMTNKPKVDLKRSSSNNTTEHFRYNNNL